MSQNLGTNLVDKKFTFLYVIRISDPILEVSKTGKINKRKTWLCKCDCGNELVVREDAILGGFKKSCGCRINPSRIAFAKPKLDPKEAAIRDLYGKHKWSAKCRNLCQEIDIDQFKILIQQSCFYCGKPPAAKHSAYMDRGYTSQHETTEHAKSAWIYWNGLDRMDNDVGYTVENTVTCCKICNIAKHTRAAKEYIEWLDQLVAFQKTKI